MRDRITARPANKILVDKSFLSRVDVSNDMKKRKKELPQLLFITSFPPRECGIATYSQDLIKALNDKFDNSFNIKICALENDTEMHTYPKEVKYILNTQHEKAFKSLANIINLDSRVKMVVIQHEFGFFAECQTCFIDFLNEINKTKVTVFHTVLPNADEVFKSHVKEIALNSDALIVMTEKSATILKEEYGVNRDKISVIAHGTHLVAHTDKEVLKEKYGFQNRKILSTFGLLSSGKSIETTLDALPDVVKTKPDVLFLIIGKTHPGIVKQEGEKYREFLEDKVKMLHLENNVKFINKYVALEELLEYLQLTDIYLFTSKDPNQAVSGTFSYAVSCGCAVVSTPIPHAKEFLSGDSGIIFDFQDSKQLGEAINKLLFDVTLRNTIKLNALHKIVPTVWENAAVSHALLFENLSNGSIILKHRKPAINLDHFKKLTTDFGMIQFSKINKPDRESGYTLDDNARAMIAMCQHFEITKNKADLHYIDLYLNFIQFCQQADGRFLNYVDYKNVFTDDNLNCNLEDSNGRAIWALGYLISMSRILPAEMVSKADQIIQKMLPNAENIFSTRAMAFIIKGLAYYNVENDSKAVRLLIKKLADRLTQMYLHEALNEWKWFESYLTYANSLLPEALLMAYQATGEATYKEVAKNAFDFLLSQTFDENGIKVISNRNWLKKGDAKTPFGEQPIDVAYTILALDHFYDCFKEDDYKTKIKIAFEWFLGRNHLNQIIYNPCTGGCYDGLEETSVNLNQGAESTVSYLMARLAIEKSDQMLESRTSKVIRLKLENYAFNA